MDNHARYRHLKDQEKSIRFDFLCSTAEKFGFCCRGGRSRQRIFVRSDIREMLNFQDCGGKAKPYQVRQLCKIIEKYSLLEETDHA